MIRYEEDQNGELTAVCEVVVGVESRALRFPIGRWEVAPPGAGLAGIAVVVCPDAKTLDLVRAGTRRSGRDPSIRVMPCTADCARHLLVAMRTGAEAVVIMSGGRDALTTARALGGRALPALPLADPDTVASLFDTLEVDVNVPVPAADGHLRETIREILAPLGLEARHHVVEVDPRPAFDEAGRDIRDANLNELGAAAAGVLAGRLAAGSRRWRQSP